MTLIQNEINYAKIQVTSLGRAEKNVRVNWNEAKSGQENEFALEYFLRIFQNWTLHLWRRLCHDCNHRRRNCTKKGWMNEEEMGDMISVSGSAPGGVAVNSATFIGYRLGGVAGAVVAVTAITLPTF